MNSDTVARTLTVAIHDSGSNVVTYLVNGSAAAGAYIPFPTSPTPADNGVAAAGAKFLVSGTMQLVATVAAMAIGQDSTFAVALRLRSSSAPSRIYTFDTGGAVAGTATEYAGSVF